MISAVETASLNLVAEFLRRYPDGFSVYETHPCDGQYDCLSVLYGHQNEHVFDFNRVGRIHLCKPNDFVDVRPIEWNQILEGDDFLGVLNQLSE
ncbi:TY-Chap2 family putative peptide chaperone [Coraliomargarita sp. W4R72]